MFIFLSKVLAPLCLPLGLALILLIGAFVWARRVRVARALIGAVVIGLWVLATPACGNRMLGGLERRYPLRPAAAEPAADAIVVLGGGTTGRGPDQPEVELGSSGTRLLHAYRLYRAGKARVLILSGGNIASEQ